MKQYNSDMHTFHIGSLFDIIVQLSLLNSVNKGKYGNETHEVHKDPSAKDNDSSSDDSDSSGNGAANRNKNNDSGPDSGPDVGPDVGDEMWYENTEINHD